LEDAAFHARVRAGYQELVKRFSHRYVVLDGTQSPAAVLAAAHDAIAARRRAIR
jgi:thymidylate kinase